MLNNNLKGNKEGGACVSRGGRLLNVLEKWNMQIYERVRISLAEVNEKVGRFVISVRNKVQKS